MIRSASSALQRLCLQLCIGLMLMFASTSAANAVDRVQHGGTVVAAHHHSPLSLATMATDDGHHDLTQDDDHHATSDHDGGADIDGDGHQPGHHHHADTSGLPAFAVTNAAIETIAGVPASASPDPLLLSLSIHGPERPPKPATSTA